MLVMLQERTAIKDGGEERQLLQPLQLPSGHSRIKRQQALGPVTQAAGFLFLFIHSEIDSREFPDDSMIKNTPCNAGARV